MNYVYGPIQSRRLGRSLGVDPIPFKTCNWNCVYCQLGRSMPMTNMRCDYIAHEAIVAEVALAIEQFASDDIDWISFAGSGEPTLHSHLGWLIRAIKQLTPIPVAVITNGALLHLPEVRADLMAADAVMPTVAAGSAEIYKKLHRPYPACTYDRVIDGLLHFRQQYHGKLWVEVMLVKGVNDSDDALAALADVLIEVVPDGIHIVTPDRPSSEAWSRAPAAERIEHATTVLQAVAPVLPSVGDDIDFVEMEDVGSVIKGIIQRHPLSEDQIVDVMAQHIRHDSLADTLSMLRQLSTSEDIRPIVRNGVTYWTVDEAQFATSI